MAISNFLVDVFGVYLNPNQVISVQEVDVHIQGEGQQPRVLVKMINNDFFHIDADIQKVINAIHGMTFH